MSRKQVFNQQGQERIARFAIDHLSTISDCLEATVAELMDDWSIPYTPDIGADTMSLAFVTKQREHLRSVQLLLEADAHRDALLISRTMLEGEGRLRWAFNKRPERTELWLWFGAIRDYRQTLKNQAEGRPVDANEIDQLKTLVDIHGHKYYHRDVRTDLAKAKSNNKAYQLPADPWGYSWTETSVKTMFDELKESDTYNLGYRNSSEWVHWDPRTIFRSINFVSSGATGFTEKDWNAGGLAYQIACTSLLECLKVLDDHFKLGLKDRLHGLNTQMLTILSRAIADGFENSQS